MKKIGNFQGVPCYICTKDEFIVNGYSYDNENIYIIDGDMINNNRIIGYFNGHSVDTHSRQGEMFLKDVGGKKQKSKTVSAKEVKRKRSESQEIDFDSLLDEIKFENYTTEVDNFFANLGDVMKNMESV